MQKLTFEDKMEVSKHLEEWRSISDKKDLSNKSIDYITELLEEVNSSEVLKSSMIRLNIETYKIIDCVKQ